MADSPFAFFDLHVLRAARISPGFVRVTLGGAALSDFACGGRDQRCKVFLPRPGQARAAVPREAPAAEWWPAWRRMPAGERAPMRTYTVREHRPEAGEAGELDIDFALHADTGPASRWATRARPGDPLTLLGPVTADNAGVDFRPPEGTDWHLLAADATALPAVAGILAWLPPGARARVWIEVEHAADRQELPTAADAEVTWLFRDLLPPAARRDALPAALRAARLPEGTPYAWLAGEAGTVRELRRHLTGERGLDRRRITFTGYWRRGTSEEDLIAEAIAAEAA
ncbi:siderophore-interacting protein [Streptomyces sp. DSM 44917]|uniref:Siderophore-interacting protein n=1 Tax=Streptomyces boetiae TaxID=3075541 RepID=A0ABU2LFA5_9ACTN|nr:siderophore-interacting protein [Streptomyces sp. DSM 44917]MDT0310274.1 siderophore-interacting protein [Streptomyces sp. DSM 44917]